MNFKVCLSYGSNPTALVLQATRETVTALIACRTFSQPWNRI
jgi:hypothetical protein